MRAHSGYDVRPAAGQGEREGRRGRDDPARPLCVDRARLRRMEPAPELVQRLLELSQQAHDAPSPQESGAGDPDPRSVRGSRGRVYAGFRRATGSPAADFRESPSRSSAVVPPRSERWVAVSDSGMRWSCPPARPGRARERPRSRATTGVAGARRVAGYPSISHRGHRAGRPRPGPPGRSHGDLASARRAPAHSVRRRSDSAS